MQVQNHVNTQESETSTLSAGQWPRCYGVAIRDGVLRGGLDIRRQYSLADAYSGSPHVSFLNMRTDKDLEAFTARWGPLLPADPALGEFAVPAALYWWFQHRLSAFVKLINAVRSREREQSALEEFIAAECELEELLSLPESWVGYHLGPFFPEADDPLAALRVAELKKVREVAVGMIRNTPLVVCVPGFDVDVGLRGPKIIARWTINTLETALRWMVWRDEWRGQPMLYCSECRRAYVPESKHKTKYCSPACAHRVAAREWARNRRQEDKKRKSKKGTSKKGTSGP